MRSRVFRSQTGNPNAFDWDMVQDHFATYGNIKCNQIHPSGMCKCDCDNDGIEDFSLPVPSTGAGGNHTPNYPQPLNLLHSNIVDFLCCYNMCNRECFGDQEGLTGSDGFTPIDTGTTTPRPIKRMRSEKGGTQSQEFGGLSFQSTHKNFSE